MNYEVSVNKIVLQTNGLVETKAFVVQFLVDRENNKSCKLSF